MSSQAYVVESPAIQQGVRVGTFRLWVATEARAIALASERDDRSWRAVAWVDVPDKARRNLAQARANGG